MFSRIERRRNHKRLDISVPVQVLCRETPDEYWREQTDTLDLTPVGVRFTLTRPIKKGRLIKLIMSMPVQLRKYDHMKADYEVWAAVRFVSGYKLFGHDRRVDQQFEVGVALIGRHAPESYQQDPTLLYELAPPEKKDGFWVAYLPEPEPEEEIEEVVQREGEVTEVIIEVLNQAGNVIEREETLTRNISEHQAVIPVTVNAKVGSMVRLSSPDGQNLVTARVVNHTTDENGIVRAYLSFVGAQWRRQE